MAQQAVYADNRRRRQDVQHNHLPDRHMPPVAFAVSVVSVVSVHFLSQSKPQPACADLYLYCLLTGQMAPKQCCSFYHFGHQNGSKQTANNANMAIITSVKIAMEVTAYFSISKKIGRVPKNMPLICILANTTAKQAKRGNDKRRMICWANDCLVSVQSRGHCRACFISLRMSSSSG
jgi:hypothetical protein